jgi:hypothetical protein
MMSQEPSLFRPVKRRRLPWLVLFALAAAVGLSLSLTTMEPEERLVRVQAAEEYGQDSIVAAQPADIQALLLDYRSDRLLALKARAALLVYPSETRQLLRLYGTEPEFRRALAEHGEHLVPPVIYFYRHPVGSVEALNRLARAWQATGRMMKDYFGNNAAGQSQQPQAGGELTPEQRGWYAVNFALQEGQDFTGQFVVAPGGDIEWLWTERIMENAVQFLTSGIANLEKRYRTDQPIGAADIGWAAVDAVIIGGSLKLLKAGRAAAVTTRSASLGTRSAAFSARMARVGQMASVLVRNGKWPALVALGYVAIRHPALLNDLFASVAGVLGVPPRMMQVTGWFLLLMGLMLVLRLLWWLGPGWMLRGMRGNSFR